MVEGTGRQKGSKFHLKALVPMQVVVVRQTRKIRDRK
jgi:hypothetical protein